MRGTTESRTESHSFRDDASDEMIAAISAAISSGMARRATTLACSIAEPVIAGRRAALGRYEESVRDADKKLTTLGLKGGKGGAERCVVNEDILDQ